MIYPGDIFNKWNPSPEAINFAVEHLPQGWAIAGNHDLPNHRYGDIKRSAYWTLVEARVLMNMKPDTSHRMSDDLMVQAFPWDTPLRSPMKADGVKLHAAIVHSYIWIAGREHPGAPPEKHASEFAKKLVGYDAAFFGDNHACFELPVHREDDKFTHIVNCGCLIPRRSPERKYKPTVWLLLSDGSVRPHQLDTSLDKWTDIEEAAELLGSGQMNSEDMADFIGSLKRAGNTVSSFSEALQRAISDRTGKVPPEVAKFVREWINGIVGN